MSIANIFPAPGNEDFVYSISNPMQMVGYSQSGNFSFTGWSGSYNIYLIMSNASPIKSPVMLLITMNVSVASGGTGGFGVGPQINFNDPRMYFSTLFAVLPPNQTITSSTLLQFSPVFTNGVVTGVIMNSPNVISTQTYESYLLLGM